MATVARNSGRGNWYAYCTVPKALRSILKKPKIRRTLGTSDIRIANSRLREVEASIWQEFDRASQQTHPLVATYIALADSLDMHSVAWRSYGQDASAVSDFSALFDSEERWLWFDEIRDQAGLVVAEGSAIGMDPETDIGMDQARQAIEPLLEEFSKEFRKVSSEDYAPKTRSVLYKEVAAKYLASYQFTDGIKREKTRDDYRANIEKFMRWAGDVDLSAFLGIEGKQFMNRYADEMANNRVIIPKFRGEGVSAATLRRHFSSVVSVLVYAKAEGIIADSLWSGYKETCNRKAAPEVKPIPFSQPQIVELLALQKKPREQLLLKLCVGTGCRLDELALLTWEQVCFEDVDGVDVPYLDFEPLETIVKRLASHRRLPLVPEVFACLPPRNKSPFSCKKEPNRLFNYPKKKDGKTDAASKAGMRVIRRLHSNPRLNNHSFRHYFVDKTREAENYLPAGAVDYVTGHSFGDSERSNYGHGYGLKQVYQGLLKLDFSFLTSFD